MTRRVVSFTEETVAGTTQAVPKQKSSTPAKRTRKTVARELRLPTHEAIATRARELFEQSGYASGRDVEFWLEAERQLGEELNS